MRFLKTFGLTVLAVTSFTAFAASASATTLTSPEGTTLGVGTKIKATAEAPLQTHLGPITPTCQKSTLEGQIEKAGGASETVEIPLTTLTFQECGNGLTIAVLKPGRLEIHTSGAEADGNGTVTWSGAELTTMTHYSVFGFPITAHCVYYTSNTHFGTLKGSKNREGKTATLDLESVEFPLIETAPWCKEGAIEEVVWTGSYVIENPDYLNVD